MAILTFKQAKNVFIKRYHLQYNIFNLNDTEVVISVKLRRPGGLNHYLN